jgi:hypothetical protein
VRRIALIFALAWAGCDRGDVAANICASDSDCEHGLHCIARTGVCVGTSTSLDAAVPDLGNVD